jgi:hypothetical protein
MSNWTPPKTCIDDFSAMEKDGEVQWVDAAEVAEFKQRGWNLTSKRPREPWLFEKHYKGQPRSTERYSFDTKTGELKQIT